jgi:ABC-type nitrate/sulfonate/bicarbonate transport system substrate-binding protein
MAPIVLGINGGTGRLYAGPTLVALGRGYFAKQGLDVQVPESSGRRGSMPMLAAGELDVSPQGPSLEFCRVWSPERPIVMVADHGSMRPGRGSGAIQVLADQSGYRPEAVAKDMVPEGLNPDGYLNVDDIAAELHWFEQEGLLPQPIPVDCVIEYRFLEAALAELGC